MQFLELKTPPEAPLVTGGTATAYTITPTYPATAYAPGARYCVNFNVASGASPTLTISGLATPPTLVRRLGNGAYINIGANDIPAGWVSYVTLLSATQALVEQVQDVLAGTIISYAGTSAPPGYLVCPVAATNISRTAYAALFAAIGTTWGAGDGTTTFGMPFFPADYSALQANGNVGTNTVGQVINHVHSGGVTAYPPYIFGGGATAAAIIQANTGNPTTGGTQNTAAGVRVLRCVKY